MKPIPRDLLEVEREIVVLYHRMEYDMAKGRFYSGQELHEILHLRKKLLELEMRDEITSKYSAHAKELVNLLSPKMIYKLGIVKWHKFVFYRLKIIFNVLKAELALSYEKSYPGGEIGLVVRRKDIVVFFLHDILRSSSDFSEVCSFLLGNNISVHARDLKYATGHERDIHTQKWTEWVEDVELEFRVLKKDFPSVYIVGGGLGGALALILASKFRTIIRGVITISAASRPYFNFLKQSVGAKEFLEQEPKKIIHNGIKELSTHPKFKLRLSLASNINRLYSHLRKNLRHVIIPVLCINSRGRDQINGASPSDTNYILRAISTSKDFKQRVFSGADRELVIRDKLLVFSAITHFIKYTTFDAIIALGGPIDKKKEEPWDLTKERVNEAAQLFSSGFAPTIIFTGKGSPVYQPGKKHFPYSEAQLMARYAIGLNVPRDSIILEERAKDTIGNAFYARVGLMRMGLRRNGKLVIVTSNLNMSRVKAVFDGVFGGNYRLLYIRSKDTLPLGLWLIVRGITEPIVTRWFTTRKYLKKIDGLWQDVTSSKKSYAAELLRTYYGGQIPQRAGSYRKNIGKVMQILYKKGDLEKAQDILGRFK